MFASFFYLFRENGLRVSLTEWLDLMAALDRGLVPAGIYQFYVLGRALLVKKRGRL